MTEEKRIYVVVPETIQVDKSFKVGTTSVPWVTTIPMCAGRLMAQCAHIVSKMRWHEELGLLPMTQWEPITTIVLSVRNTRELQKVFYELSLLSDGPGVASYPFYDTNSDVYGTPEPQFTAFCTNPVLKADVDAALGHLELYGA